MKTESTVIDKKVYFHAVVFDIAPKERSLAGRSLILKNSKARSWMRIFGSVVVAFSA
jgi:hypothetical protein